MKIKILIVDDHSFTRAGVRAILQTNKDFEIVGEAVDGNDAIIKAREKQPDIIIMDINMPGLSGIEATKQILAENDAIKIMALSMHVGDHFVKEMLNAGVVGYMLKDDVPEDLVKAIKKIVQGEMILSTDITRAALSKRHDILDLNIMRTKLYPPQITTDYVFRKNIINTLEKNVNLPLSLISAGAGYGKSVVVGQWLENTSYLSAWISLDAEHNNFRTFMFYLVSAINNAFPDAMKDTYYQLQSNDFHSFKIILNSFINEICNIDNDFILVLDNYHLIRDEKVHHFLDEWIRFPPPNVHLSIISRRDPPLKTKLLSNSGRIIEIRMKDLSFSNDEIATLYLNLLGINLDLETIEKLQNKTEGWIIGLRLASMAIKDENDFERILQSLDSGKSNVSDYLMNEVLLKQSDEMIQSLIESSILNQFNAELIAHISTVNNKEKIFKNELINWLVKSNIFVISLDDNKKWFRYHHLFQKLLQNLLIERKSKKQINNLHKLASNWFEENNFIQESIIHSLKENNTDRAVEIIEKNWETAFEKSEWLKVEKWLALLPEEVLVKSANLLLARFWVYQKINIIHEIPKFLSLIKQTKSNLTDSEKGYFYFAESLNFLLNGAVEKALVYTNKALKLISKKQYYFRVDIYAWKTMEMQMLGQGKEAIHIAQKALKNIDLQANPFLASRRSMHINFVHILETDIKAVRYSLNDFFALPNTKIYILAFGRYFEANICWWRFDLENIIIGFDKIINIKYQCRPSLVIDAYIGKALALQEQYKTAEANDAIKNGILFAESTNNLENINLLKSGEVRLQLLRGETEMAEKWLKNTKHHKLNFTMLWWIEVSSITQCRVFIAMNTTASLNQAIKLLKEYKIYATSIFNKIRTVEIIVLEARAQLKLKQEATAIKLLEEALELIKDDQFIRPFIDATGELKELLLQIKEKGVKVDFVSYILDKINLNADRHSQNLESQKKEVAVNQQKKLQPFTRKEMEVLHCVTEGLQNSEIADKLYNSEQTIKKHLSNMFQKIQVKNRMTLISKAKELGIID